MDSTETAQKPNIAPPPHHKQSRGGRIALVAAGVIAVIALVAFIASFFLDGMIGPRIQSAMNSRLKGYHVTLGKVHLQLVGMRLTLKKLVILQEAHPNPPVADLPEMRFHLHWAGLFRGHVVATVDIWNPRIHINQPQLVTEVKSKVPLRERGWQDALEAAYPFKIDQLAIHNGDIMYIDAPKAKPLHVTQLNFITDNIRNIKEPNNIYPSTFSGSMLVFGPGRLRVNGRANYLMAPFPGVDANYVIDGAPLEAMTPASRHANLMISGGTLSSDGAIEYSPKVTRAKINNVKIDRVALTYLNLAHTQEREKTQVKKAGEAVKEENNRPGVEIDVKKLAVRDSRLGFKDENADPPYTLFLSDADLTITNFTNHAAHGESHLDLTGKFMGTGDTHIFGTFLASGGGPQFSTNIQIVRTNLTDLNPLMRAHGRIDVAHGYLTVYSQIGVKNSHVTGYVKPLFSEVQVYSREKDKTKNVMEQAKEMVVGAAAHVFRNAKTNKVATQVSLAGDLKKPNVSTWEAFVQVLRNAFVSAILPGFDRQLTLQGARTP
jgi:uncharacterized protein DUF748